MLMMLMMLVMLLGVLDCLCGAFECVVMLRECVDDVTGRCVTVQHDQRQQVARDAAHGWHVESKKNKDEKKKMCVLKKKREKRKIDVLIMGY